MPGFRVVIWKDRDNDGNAKWHETLWGFPDGHPDKDRNSAQMLTGYLTMPQAKAAVKYAREQYPDARYAIERYNDATPNIALSDQGIEGEGVLTNEESNARNVLDPAP